MTVCNSSCSSTGLPKVQILYRLDPCPPRVATADYHAHNCTGNICHAERGLERIHESQRTTTLRFRAGAHGTAPNYLVPTGDRLHNCVHSPAVNNSGAREQKSAKRTQGFAFRTAIITGSRTLTVRTSAQQEACSTLKQTSVCYGRHFAHSCDVAQIGTKLTPTPSSQLKTTAITNTTNTTASA